MLDGDRRSKGLVLTASGTVCTVAGVVLLLIPRGHHADVPTARPPLCTTSIKTSAFFRRRCSFPQPPMTPASRAVHTPERPWAKWSATSSESKLGASAARFGSVRAPRIRPSLVHELPVRRCAPRYAPVSETLGAAQSDDVGAPEASPLQECSSAWQLSARLAEAEAKLSHGEHLLTAHHAEAVARQEAANLEYLELQREHEHLRVDYAEAVARQEAANLQYLELQQEHEHLRAELKANRSIMARRAAAAREAPNRSSYDSALSNGSEQGARPGYASSQVFEENVHAVVPAIGALVDPRTTGDAANLSVVLLGTGSGAANLSAVLLGTGSGAANDSAVLLGTGSGAANDSAVLLGSVSEIQRMCGCLRPPSPPSAGPLCPIWPHLVSATLALLALALRLQARRDRAVWNEQRANLERRALAAEEAEGGACASAGSPASPPRVGASCGDDWVDAGAETADPHPRVLGASMAASPLWGTAAHEPETLLPGIAADSPSHWGRVVQADRRWMGGASDSEGDVRSLSSASDAAGGGCITSSASDGSAADASIVDEAEEPEGRSPSPPKVTAQAPAQPTPQATAADTYAGAVTLFEARGLEKAGGCSARDARRASETEEGAGGVQVEAGLGAAVRPLEASQRDPDLCGSICVQWVGAEEGAHEESPPSVISPLPPPAPGLTLPKNLLTMSASWGDVGSGSAAAAAVGAHIAMEGTDTHIASTIDAPLEAHTDVHCAPRAYGLESLVIEAQSMARPMCAASPAEPPREDGQIGLPWSPDLTLTPRCASDYGSALAYHGGARFDGSHGAAANGDASAKDMGEACGASTDNLAPSCPRLRVSAADFDELGLPGRLACRATAAADDLKEGASPRAPALPLTDRTTHGLSAGFASYGQCHGPVCDTVARDSPAPPRGSPPGPLISDVAEIAPRDPQSSLPFAAHLGERARLQPPERPESLLSPSRGPEQPEYEYESPPEDEVNETIDLEDDESVLVLPLGTPPNSPPSQPATSALHSLPLMVGSASSGPATVVSSDRLCPLLPPVSSASDASRAGDAATRAHSRVVAPPIREHYF